MHCKVAIAFLAAGLLGGIETASAFDGHESRIFIPEAGIATDHTNIDSNTWQTAYVGYVGQPVRLTIHYEIGPFTAPDTGGSMVLSSNDVPNPEYLYFCPNDENCDIGGALGLSFDGAAGVVSGTPTHPGRFEYFPAVRDKDNGENAYNGQGAWWTTFATANGKTWSEAKQSAVIIILSPPGPKHIDLQCTFANPAVLPVAVTLDFDNGYVEVLGTDGKLGGIYRINNPDGDVIGWSGMPGYVLSNGVSLDRTTGNLIGMTYANAPVAGQCQKRSTKRVI